MDSTYHRAIKAIPPSQRKNGLKSTLYVRNLTNAHSCLDSRTLINENAEYPPQSSPPVHRS